MFHDFCVFLKKNIAFLLHFQRAAFEKWMRFLFRLLPSQSTLNSGELVWVDLVAKAFITIRSEGNCHQ